MITLKELEDMIPDKIAFGMYPPFQVLILHNYAVGLQSKGLSPESLDVLVLDYWQGLP